jgi:von Willebrand factor type A domain
MRPVAALVPCIFLMLVASSAQETAAIPIIVAGASQSSIPVQPSDFNVDVNSKPVSVASLIPLSGKHLRYVLINDARAHDDWPGGTDQQIHVAKEFLKKVISPGVDTGTLVSYGELVLLGPQNEKDPRKLASEVGLGRTSPARLYDAITAGTSVLAKQQSGSDERKVVFLVCDGKETGSQVGMADPLNALQKASFPIFVFAPSDVGKRKEGQRLRELAERSGGRAYFLPPDTRHLTFDGLKRDLADSFLLTLNVPSQKGLLPLSATGVGHPQLSIVAPSQVFVP